MPYNDERREYMREYLGKQSEVRFRVPPAEHERYKAAAEREGYKSLRQFLLAAIEEKIKRGEHQN